MLRKLGLLAIGTATLALALAWFGRVPYAQWRAERFLAERDWPGTRRWLDRAESWSSGNGRTQFLLARLARKQGDLKEVEIRLARALEAGYPAELVEREQWLVLAQQGHLEQVMPKLELLLTDQRGDGREICEAYIQGFIRMRQFSGAGDLLDAWIADHPQDARPLFIRSTLHREFQRWEKAEADLRSALSIEPDNAEYAVALGIVLQTRQLPEEALAVFRSVKHDPQQRESVVAGEIKCLRALGRIEEARQLAEAELQNKPSETLIVTELARLEMEAGNYGRVVELMKPLIAAAPRNADYHYLIATAYLSNGQETEGREHMQQSQLLSEKVRLARQIAEEIRPDQSSIEDRYRVGVLFLEYGDEQEGLIWLLSVLNLHPRHEPTLVALANYYESKSATHPEYADVARQFRARIDSRPADDA